MTYEEAISIVRCWVRSRGAYTDHATWQTNNEVAKLAIEALEKQVPKKPIEDWSESPFSDDKGCLFLHTMCPNCKKVEVNKMDSFCYNCGQAILWEDTE